MNGFATSPNPFLSGTRPRAFFAARVAMLRRDQRIAKSSKKSSTNLEDLTKTSVKKAA